MDRKETEWNQKTKTYKVKYFAALGELYGEIGVVKDDAKIVDAVSEPKDRLCPQTTKEK